MESQHEKTTLSESSANEVTEAVMEGENDLSTQDPVHNVKDMNGLMELFDQFLRLMLPMSD